MYTVQFSPFHFVEHADAREFDRRVGKWLFLREAENSYILGNLRDILAGRCDAGGAHPRLFSLEDDGAVAAAAVLFSDGMLVFTWATLPMLRVLAQGLAVARCQIKTIFAPAHLSGPFASIWAELTGQRWAMGPEERVYQLARLRCDPPPTGRLELAAPAHQLLVLPWMENFIRETDYVDRRAAPLVETLIRQQQLYLWLDPQPVSMAAWVMPTLHAACINFVYTPPELRGRGHGKAVVSALARHMLDSGLQFCFIYTGTSDLLSNSLYQKVGARTLCEFMRCAILPPLRQGAPAGAALIGS